MRRNPVDEIFDHFRIGKHLRVAVRRDDSRRNRIRCNSKTTIAPRNVYHHVHQRRFRRSIDGQIQARPIVVDAADADDTAEIALFHDWQRTLQQDEIRLYVRGIFPIVLFRCEIFESHICLHGGVQHENVWNIHRRRKRFRLRFVCQIANGFFAGNSGLFRFFYRRVQLVRRPAAVEHDLRPRKAIRHGDGLADASGGSRHQRRLARQIKHFRYCHRIT